MGWYLFSGRARVVPKIRGLRIQRAMLFDILKVGLVSCFSPLQSVLTISIFTHMLAGFGTAVLAGYGIGARLEFLLDLGGVFGRHCLGADGRHGDRRGTGRTGAADRLDRGPRVLHLGRRGRQRHRDLSGSLGQHLHAG